MSDEIKVTGTPVEYGDGAIRNTKEGKGRFDLIPPEPFRLITATVIEMKNQHAQIDISKHGIWEKAFNTKDYVKAIIALTIRHYALDDNQQTELKFAPVYLVSIDEYDNGVWKMLFDLARHFQRGAEIYGEHNCERGIPEWSFCDSGLRHLAQYFAGLDDEPHLISAIWNFWMLLWTILKKV